MSDEPLVFAVNAKGTIGYAPVKSAVSAAPRPLQNKRQEQYDEMRRPQAALMFRSLKANSLLGMSWRECWALGEGNSTWDVGPIVVWLRAHGVDIDARYDSAVGETRFYLIEPPRKNAVGESGGL